MTCTRTDYTMRTRVDTGYGGQSSVWVEFLDPSRKVITGCGGEMIPRNGGGCLSQGSSHPDVLWRARSS